MRRALVIAAFATAAWLLAGVAIDRLVPIDRARFEVPEAPRVVTDREGAVIQVVRGGGVDQRWVELGAVSPNLVSALIAAEDQRFFAHRGVDLRATARAAWDTLAPWRRRTGASTLTQQVIKLTHGRPHGLWSKPVEVLRALALERSASKDEILVQYVNRVPFGHNVVGVARACEVYLGRSPGAVTVAEAALLAGLPQSPSRLDPAVHLRRAVARRDSVLRRMREAGFIDDRALAEALAEAPRWATAVHPRGAERYVEALLRASPPAEGRAWRGSISEELQREAVSLMAGTVARWRPRGATNGAAIVLSNRTGEVLTYVGAADPSGPGGALDLLRAARQPGSTLKPFVYTLLFERGATPATVMADVHVAMRGARGETAEARDYDGQERGPVAARDALASSLNLAALDAATRVGASAIVGQLRALGVEVPGEARGGMVRGGAGRARRGSARAGAGLPHPGAAGLARPTLLDRALGRRAGAPGDGRFCRSHDLGGAERRGRPRSRLRAVASGAGAAGSLRAEDRDLQPLARRLVRRGRPALYRAGMAGRPGGRADVRRLRLRGRRSDRGAPALPREGDAAPVEALGSSGGAHERG